MFICLSELIDTPTLDAVAAAFDSLENFEDGTATAGRRARLVKNNLQNRPSGKASGAARLIERRLLDSDLFLAAARPKRIVRTLLSRYTVGMHYGRHVDEALIEGVRTDLSFTLFLSDPAQYDGGELVVDEPTGEREFKLNRGDLVLYPSTTLHEVRPVKRGERRAVVGWVRSHVRDPQAREVLFDLALGSRQAEAAGESALVDRLSKVTNNLLRMWAED